MCLGAARRICVCLRVSVSNVRSRIPRPLFGSMTYYMSPSNSSKQSWKETLKTDLKAIAINQAAWIDIQNKRLECRGLCKENVMQIVLAQDESVGKAHAQLADAISTAPGHCPRTLPQDNAPGHCPRTLPQDIAPGHCPRTLPQDIAPGHCPRTLFLAQVFSSASQAYLRQGWSNTMAAVSSLAP